MTDDRGNAMNENINQRIERACVARGEGDFEQVFTLSACAGALAPALGHAIAKTGVCNRFAIVEDQIEDIGKGIHNEVRSYSLKS